MYSLILDVTAGNRCYWKNKHPPQVIFIDKEYGLNIPPDILAVWEHLPIRSGLPKVTVLFDPPHMRIGQNSRHNNPRGWHKVDGKWVGGTWWGNLGKDKEAWVKSFHLASQEFYRVSDILCLKWNEYQHKLEAILPIFSLWFMLQKKPHHNRKRRGKTNTYWVTFVKEAPHINDN